jgi:hypothetical protein
VSTKKTPAARRTVRPTLEALEDRWVPSTLTVLNNLDSGAGSLRAEIAAAHNSDTIVFASRLNGQTITLTSGEVLISHNVTIAGPGAGQLTVSGNNASRVFEVAKSTKSVTLSGLTISKGSANGSTTFKGGGIYNAGTLTVSNSTLSYNTAGNGGGGIANDGTLTVSGSTLSGNSSAAGGGIANDGTLTVSGSTLSGNTADRGGGIFSSIGTVTVSNSTISSNTANQGGAIYLRDGALTVSGTTLSSNVATGGGGILNSQQGTLTISGSTLSGNSASEGGGIENFGTVTVNNSSRITGNTALVGFGVDVYNLGVLYLDISSIIGILDGNPAVPI